MKDEEIKWFRPLWLRVLVTAVIAAWLAYEVFVSQDGLWIAVTGAALAYAVWNLFIRFDASIEKADKGSGPPPAA